jgi:hypothetical protein
MKIEFELVTYDDTVDKFELDEAIYSIEINEDDAQTYEILKDSDMSLYNWLKESDSFVSFLANKLYADGVQRKIAISDINGKSYRRFYFFKVSSGDSHYDYFKKFFNIFEESDWQDREEIGSEILEHLIVKRQDLIIELDENMMESNDGEV